MVFCKSLLVYSPENDARFLSGIIMLVLFTNSSVESLDVDILSIDNDKVVLKGIGKAKVTVFNDSITESLIGVCDKGIIRFY